MHFSISFLNEFVDELVKLDKSYKAAMAEYEEISEKIKKYGIATKNNAVASVKDGGIGIYEESKEAVIAFRANEDSCTQEFLTSHDGELSLISRCQRALGMVKSAEASVRNQMEYESYHKNKKKELSFSAETFLEKPEEIIEMAYEVNHALKGVRAAEKKDACVKLYTHCRRAEHVLNKLIEDTRVTLYNDKPGVMDKLKNNSAQFSARLDALGGKVEQYFADSSKELEEKYRTVSAYTEEKTKGLKNGLDAKLKSLRNDFLSRFPYMELAQEFDEIYRDEPNYNDYSCTEKIPRSIRIGDLEQDVSGMELSDFAKDILDKYYSFMFRGTKLSVPHSAEFDGDFNYIFRYGGNASDRIRELASGIGMRLFMMMQLGKVNFTFYDPVALGGSFAEFSRLVDMDTRSSELINGQIWTSSEDIESKLRILTEHISGITQRCLRGEFDNIYGYNKDAGYNAEAYQVIMVMDYPAGLSDEALRLLEQVAQSGPKCGVFTVIFSSAVQKTQLEGSVIHLAESLETYFTSMQYDAEHAQFKCLLSDASKKFIWKPAPGPAEEQSNIIADILRESIKNMDKIVIGTERVKNAERSDSTLKGIRVPIGIHGANSVQYLTLGSGGCHHALIAGVAGMGKSSLLHTIVMHALEQYSPEELEIYLVDFKRGVEFKIYADYRVPQFRVIAIESEREFGYNVLKAIDREQKIRADIFKNAKGGTHVEKIEQYRQNGGKMPRILVIMDEFHELFTEDDEISTQSAIMMERIVRQGRAFGVHMILASQSYANVKGLDKAVYDQMAVRIVMKCSSDDADMLLENGSGMVDLISIEDAGKAVYNSDGGSKEACSMFRSVYIYPQEHSEKLAVCAEKYMQFPADKTRILLSNIEDNAFCKFNRFAEDDYKAVVERQMIIGEPLAIDTNMNMDFARESCSNMLMVGDNTEKARNMLTFSLVSICVDYWLKHGKKAPEKPIIHFMNFKPLNDSYFVDIPKMISDALPAYIDYVNCGDADEIGSLLGRLYGQCSAPEAEDEYVMIFGYQRAEILRSEAMIEAGGGQVAICDAVRYLLDKGPKSGIHTLIWQDKFKGSIAEDSDMLSRFNMRVAFEMPADALMSFVMEENINAIDENTAVYYNSLYDNQRFRSYQTPNIDWMKALCEKLK